MAPTYREIADRFGFSSANAVRSHLRLMAKKGMVTLPRGKARGLKVMSVLSQGIHLLGSIAAGQPLDADQNTDEVLPIAPSFFGGIELFALRIRGDSMKDAGIFSGDVVVVNRQQDVSDGEIAAVLIENEATLKFVFRQNGTVTLRGANPAFSDIVIRGDDSRSVRILGKYVGLIRREGVAA